MKKFSFKNIVAEWFKLHMYNREKATGVYNPKFAS